MEKERLGNPTKPIKEGCGAPSFTGMPSMATRGVTSLIGVKGLYLIRLCLKKGLKI